MSDMTSCLYCNGSYSPTGFIHERNCPTLKPTTRGDIICPICGDEYFRCDHYPNNLISEIYRLRSELTNGQELLGYALAEADGLKAAIEQANIERDKYRDIRDVVWKKVLQLRSELQASYCARERIYQEWYRVIEQRNEARSALEMTENENALWRGHVQKGSVVIAELQSRLEQAERDVETQRKCIGATADERDKALENVEQMRSATLTALDSSDKVSRLFLAERDEARQWAGYFYRMYLIERKNYLDINDDENIWF